MLGGGASTPEAQESIEYKGFVITPAPMQEGREYRVAAIITKGEGDEQKSHRFIRSDVMANHDLCIETTLFKAQLTIDQLGDGIFN